MPRPQVSREDLSDVKVTVGFIESVPQLELTFPEDGSDLLARLDARGRALFAALAGNDYTRWERSSADPGRWLKHRLLRGFTSLKLSKLADQAALEKFYEPQCEKNPDLRNLIERGVACQLFQPVLYESGQPVHLHKPPAQLPPGCEWLLGLDGALEAASSAAAPGQVVSVAPEADSPMDLVFRMLG